MKNLLENYLSAERWLLVEKHWRPQEQAVRETQLTLGNGYLGSRGILEENPPSCSPGTYIAGLFDKTAAQVAEMVNLPNPVNFRIIARGEKVGLGAMDALQHERVLDMRKGLLVRQTLFHNSRKERFDYQSGRFFSLVDKHVFCFQANFTPLNGPVELTVQTRVNTDVTNKGVLTEGRKKHFEIVEISKTKGANYLEVETLQSKVRIAYAACFEVLVGGKRIVTTDRTIKLKLEKGQMAHFTKYVSIHTSFDVRPKQIKAAALKCVQKQRKKGFDKLLAESAQAWKKDWERSAVSIKDSKEVQKAVTFNLYHLLIAAPERGEAVSVGARTLSGEGYRGHIFWDAEIFVLPFFIYTNREAAESMLLYRYQCLEEARKIAQRKGYRGVLFPWESADFGRETAPTWHKDLDGSIVRIHTASQEQHISADVAYAFYQYYLATGSEEFMRRCGFEVLFETARFWASRVKYNNRKKKYEIKHVMGPDEFHSDVNNNIFTNGMARWNLLTAAKLYYAQKRVHPEVLKKISRKLRLREKEVENWKRIAANMVGYISSRGVIEQFEGFFTKKYIPIKELDSYFMPLFPKGVPLSKVGQTQLVKQPDTLMLMYLLSDRYQAKAKKVNFDYYDRRTLHKSSLSPPISAIAAVDAGQPDKAYRYFLYALNADLKNLHGNTAEGIHAASLGGVWQAVVFGFAGMRLKRGMLSFQPCLPAPWKKLKFSIYWRQFSLQVTVSDKRVELSCVPLARRKRGKFRVEIYGKVREIIPGKKNIFRKES